MDIRNKVEPKIIGPSEQNRSYGIQTNPGAMSDLSDRNQYILRTHRMGFGLQI